MKLRCFYFFGRNKFSMKAATIFLLCCTLVLTQLKFLQFSKYYQTIFAISSLPVPVVVHKGSNIQIMSRVFYHCAFASKCFFDFLSPVPVVVFEPSNIQIMSRMFYHCSSVSKCFFGFLSPGSIQSVKY